MAWTDPADIYGPNRNPVEKTFTLMGLEWEFAVYPAISYPDETWRQGVALVNPRSEPFDRTAALTRLFAMAPRAHFIVEISVPSTRSDRPDLMMTPHYDGGRLSHVEIKQAVGTATEFARNAVILHGL